MTPEERETTIRLGDDTDQASIWACQPKIARRLHKRGVKPTEVRKQDGREISWRFVVPARWVKISPPRRVTASNRATSADRLAQGRARKKAEVAPKPIAPQ